MSEGDRETDSTSAESVPERLLADLRWKLRHNPLQVVGFLMLVVVGFEYIRLFYPGLDPTLGSLGRGVLIILGVVLLRMKAIRSRL